MLNFGSIKWLISNMLRIMQELSRKTDRDMGKKKGEDRSASGIQDAAVDGRVERGGILNLSQDGGYLDTACLQSLEDSFRAWAKDSRRLDICLSRKRILLIFLIIRTTGAKLSEVLALDLLHDIDFNRQTIAVGGRGDSGRDPRQVQISAAFAAEVKGMLADEVFIASMGETLGVDPGFVRRKFYERAQACGLDKRLATPELIRQARAVELIQGNMPLPAVQMLLGHSTPHAASSYVSFSEDEIRQAIRFFLEKESSRKTSARNSFFGKIRTIRRGIIQARVELVTLGGHVVTTVITVDSLDRLGLQTGSLITAEVKAPWVQLQKGDEPRGTADNLFEGVVERIRRGDITTEYVVRLADGTELCALAAVDSGKDADFAENDPVWVFFNSFSVILHIDR